MKNDLIVKNIGIPYVVFILGPTASGKTELSLIFAKDLGGEIINADTGQFYQFLSIGTAKPDWGKNKILHHGFDILKNPIDFSVIQYLEFVKYKIKNIWGRNNIPFIVGGSLFYIKSLFYPPITYLAERNKEEQKFLSLPEEYLWNFLNKIDPQRAKEIHPNDTYRLLRALDLWEKTGILPSKLKPRYSPFFHSRIIFINPNFHRLKDIIEKRTKAMFESGWIDEVKRLKRNKWWSNFIKNKKLIGYQEISEWIEKGEQEDKKNELINEIVSQTIRYARKQLVFWKKFLIDLKKDKESKTYFLEITIIDEKFKENIYSLEEQIKNDLSVCIHKKIVDF